MTDRCINCGAVLPPPEPGAYHIHCHFCQTDQAVAPPAAAPPMPVAGFPRAPPQYGVPAPVMTPPGNAGAGVVMIVLMAVVMLVGVGALVIFRARAGGSTAGGPIAGGPIAGGSIGGGAPFGLLAKVDPGTDIARSHDALARIFPGVTSKPFIDLDHTVTLDHPWYPQAELTWKNKAGSHLGRVTLMAPGAPKLPNQRGLEACVEKGFGKPTRRSEVDYLQHTWDTTWQPGGGGEIRVFSSLVTITLSDSPFSKDMPRATWIKVVGILDACGRR